MSDCENCASSWPSHDFPCPSAAQRDKAWKTKVGSALQDYDRAPVDDVYAAHRLVRVLRALVAETDR